MDYDVSIDHETKIVVATCTGIADVPSAAAMTRDACKQAYELGYGILYDMTDLSIALTFAEAYTFPRDIDEVYEDPEHRFCRGAILYKPGQDEEFWRFYENTAQNTGEVIRIFTDRDEAVNWLSDETSPRMQE